MSQPENTAANPKVFREEIKETRETYYVTYQPADGRLEHAHLQLTALEKKLSTAEVCKLLEKEVEHWLKRFPVPIWATAWDIAEEGIKNPGNKETVLMGFIDGNDNIVRRWGIIQKKELPSTQFESGYLACVYADVPFRLEEEVRRNAGRKWRTTVVIANTIILFIVGIPVLIEVVSLGVAWVGYLLSAVSIAKGLFEVAKALHWVKPSQRKQEKEDEERRRAHYFYHCERNPEGFNRLKAENFRRDAIERTQKEANEIRAHHTNSVSSTVRL